MEHPLAPSFSFFHAPNTRKPQRVVDVERRHGRKLLAKKREEEETGGQHTHVASATVGDGQNKKKRTRLNTRPPDLLMM
jgi:hypothetical protein